MFRLSLYESSNQFSFILNYNDKAASLQAAIRPIVVLSVAL